MLKKRLDDVQELPGVVVDVHTQGTTNAIVTFQCQRGKLTGKVYIPMCISLPQDIHIMYLQS